jgi:hypothetical protein
LFDFPSTHNRLNHRHVQVDNDYDGGDGDGDGDGRSSNQVFNPFFFKSSILFFLFLFYYH